MEIYLDSSDFSKMARPPKGQEQFFRDLSDLLQECVRTQKVVVRYSGVHMSEICQTTREYTASAKGRADVIENLCLGNCLVAWTELLSQEVTQALQPSPSSFTPFRSNNAWIDWGDWKLRELRSSLEENILNDLRDEGVSRKHRRSLNFDKLLKVFFDSSNGQDALENFRHAICEKLALPDDALPVGAIQEVLLGKSSEKFNKTIADGAMTPSVMIARLIPEFKMETKLSGVIRVSGKTLSEKLNTTMVEFTEALEAATRALRKTSAQEIASHFSADKIVGNIKIDLVRGMLRDDVQHKTKSQIDRLTDAEILALKMSSLNYVLSMIRMRINEMMSAIIARRPYRKWEAQDAGDLVHSFYALSVDVFRCDTAWAGIARKCAENCDVKIVARPEDLFPILKGALAGNTQ